MQIFLDNFYKELKHRGYSTRTIKSYSQAVEYYTTNWIKNDPNKISRENIIDFVLFLQDKGKSASTINVYKEAILFFVTNILHLQIDNIHYTKRPHTLPIVLSIEEVKILLGTIKNIKHRTMVALGYGAGLRVSEIVSLKVHDIDVLTSTIHLKGAKGNKDRIVMLPQNTQKEIGELCQGKAPNEYVFASDRGGILTTRTVQHIFQKAKEESGITKSVSFHSLRHSFATHLLEMGYDIRYIQALLGHVNNTTTQIYTHVAKHNITNIKSPLDRI